MTDRKKKQDETAGQAEAAEGALRGDPRGGAKKAAKAVPERGAMPETDYGEKLAQALAERDDYLDHLRRLQAEFENYRKRVRRDEEELRLRAAEVVVESLLPVMDNMERALQAAEEHQEGQLIDGVRLVSGQLRDTLTGHGLERVDAEPGSPFDPNVHEAVMTQPSDEYDEGAVLQALTPGYLLHGRLLRPAKVVVVR
jgi:molecular chaperone GrpE